MKGLIESIESFDVNDNGFIDLSPNYEFSTFLKTELMIKSDNLEMKYMYEIEYNEFHIFGVLFMMMDLLIIQKNLTIETHEYIEKGGKKYVKVRNFDFKELTKAYLNIKK